MGSVGTEIFEKKKSPDLLGQLQPVVPRMRRWADSLLPTAGTGIELARGTAAGSGDPSPR